MMYVVITLPHFYNEEADAITLMFQSGLQRLHLRKPGSTIGECRQLLRGIPEAYHSRIVLHDHHELVREFAVGGVHLNGRNPEPPAGWQGDVSRSCHSLEEVKEWKKRCAYVTLSPIFNSISKQGYCAAFTPEQLRQAHEQGIIDKKVIALGGICADNIREAKEYGFGGVMVLGDAWKTPLNSPSGKTLFSIPVILSIAGSDCSAGAGIQQDLKTATYCGCYATTVITAVTSQNTIGVQGVMPVPADVVESQLRSVFSDIRVDAVKIGMIPNREVAEVIIRVLREEKERRILPVVLDPVMISTSGTRLMAEDCVSLVVRELFPLCTLITPNIPEYEYLQSYHIADHNLLLKGGHADGDSMTDTLHLAIENSSHQYTSPRIATTNLHGTGCTLSSAIASYLARRQSLSVAVGNAKQVMDTFIRGGATLSIGHGNGPLWIKKGK